MRKLTGGRLLDRVAYCMRRPCKATNIIDDDPNDPTDNDYIKELKAIARAWPNMSWEQRCSKFDWRTHMRIMMVSSPKFEADIGEIDHELWNAWRENAEGKYHYRSYDVDDLSRAWKYGSNYMSVNSGYYVACTRDWRDSPEVQERKQREAREKQVRDDLVLRIEYSDALKWVDE